MKTIIIDGVEYNLTPKVSFHEGDWVMFNNKHQSIYQVEKIEDVYYILRNTHGGTFRVSVLHDESLRLWTIQDAKDGDVLAWDDSKCIALFKNIYDEYSFNSYGFIGGCTGTFESRQSYHDIEGSHPATKEQRDLLFHKMHESGYEWDAEKKELIKIEQKPAWSEEDEKQARRAVEIAREELMEEFIGKAITFLEGAHEYIDDKKLQLQYDNEGLIRDFRQFMRE